MRPKGTALLPRPIFALSLVLKKIGLSNASVSLGRPLFALALLSLQQTHNLVQ